MFIYLSLFLSAFLSATLLPGSSEILLVALAQENKDVLLLWFWATAGNTLGSVANWLLGIYFLQYQDKNWFPFKADTLQLAQRWFQRYGVWSLLLSWAPVVGDGITFIAGIMRIRLWTFVILVAVSKGLRYAILLGLVDVINRIVLA